MKSLWKGACLWIGIILISEANTECQLPYICGLATQTDPITWKKDGLFLSHSLPHTIQGRYALSSIMAVIFFSISFQVDSIGVCFLSKGHSLGQHVALSGAPSAEAGWYSPLVLGHLSQLQMEIRPNTTLNLAGKNTYTSVKIRNVQGSGSVAATLQTGAHECIQMLSNPSW